ncbi:MAG TPA: ABC transporter permease [Allosphingosinicella sp.]
MMSFLRSAFVVGRRDFVATVYSRTFLVFLAGPLLIIGISFIFGNVVEKTARKDTRSAVAVVATESGYAPIKAAYDRLGPTFGESPDLIRDEPDYDLSLQVENLLASKDKRVVAVLTGGLAKPVLTGSVSAESRTRKQMALIVDDARRRQALEKAGLPLPPADLAFVQVSESAGSIARERSATAIFAIMLIFVLTMLLAGMLLSNLIEEKSNKVIEVLSAAIPVNAIFLGKLFSMLAVSLVGVAVWVGGALLAGTIWSSGGLDLPAPAVGWPAFIPLLILYFAANYLLLGALFIGIGSQAASIREVQTLSMPISVGQMLILMLAMTAGGQHENAIGIGGAIFPFSSPLVMVSRAAQMPELWPHLLALAWQALWVWITLSLAAALFRRNVMKSGSMVPRRLRRSKA